MKKHIQKLKKLTKEMCSGDIRMAMSKLLDELAQLQVKNELKHLDEVKSLRTKIKETKSARKYSNSLTEPIV